MTLTSLACGMLLLASPPNLPEASVPAPEVQAGGAFADLGAPPEVMTLDQAIELLRVNNPDLESAAASIDDAEAVVDQALAAVKPFVGVSANYTRNNDDATIDMGQAFAGIAQALEQATGQPQNLGPVGGETIIQPLQSLTASANVQIPLFAAGAYWEIKAAKASVRARKASRDASVTALRGTLERAAWLAGAASSYVQVAERALDNAQSHRDTAQRLLDAGQSTQLAVDQAELSVLRRRTDVVVARAELARTESSLGALLGRDGPVRIALPSTPSTTTIALEAEPSLGPLDRRLEYRASKADERAARQRLKAARWNFAPTLTGTFGGSASTVAYPTGLNYGWQVGVALNWTIYAGGGRRAARRRAEASLRRALAQTRKTEVEIRQQVRDSARELELAKQRLRLVEQEVTVAVSAAQSAERTFVGGSLGSLDVLDALDAQFQAELRLEEARARVWAASADLRAAQGWP